MLKIATHDSTTGELPHWWDLLSWVTLPFAKTQSKNIDEQIKAGVRLFDLRVKKFHGKYHSGHGTFTTKALFESLVQKINNIKGPVYATLTCENTLNSEQEIKEFTEYANFICTEYNHIIWGDVVVKHVNKGFKTLWKMLLKEGFKKTIVYKIKTTWLVLKKAPSDFPGSQSKFIGLNGINWQTWIPIPYLWKKIYYDKPEFNEEYFTYVDFV